MRAIYQRPSSIAIINAPASDSRLDGVKALTPGGSQKTLVQ
jgi:hypothetical protein